MILYFIKASACYLRFATLSICLTAKAVRAKGKAPSRNGNLWISSDCPSA